MSRMRLWRIGLGSGALAAAAALTLGAFTSASADLRMEPDRRDGRAISSGDTGRSDIQPGGMSCDDDACAEDFLADCFAEEDSIGAAWDVEEGTVECRYEP